MNNNYRLPNIKKGFVHTNVKTVEQRAVLLGNYLPATKSIAEVCCGNCFYQYQIYERELQIQKFLGLDIVPAVVEANKRQGVPCVCGDALNGAVLKNFLDFDVIFFGPPLSIECDGHQLMTFNEVVPSYSEFVELLVGELKYGGTFICICPKTTTMGDIRKLYNAVKIQNDKYGLAVIHYSYSDITSDGTVTESRLKYVELWFSTALEDRWEIQESKPDK